MEDLSIFSLRCCDIDVDRVPYSNLFSLTLYNRKFEITIVVQSRCRQAASDRTGSFKTSLHFEGNCFHFCWIQISMLGTFAFNHRNRWAPNLGRIQLAFYLAKKKHMLRTNHNIILHHSKKTIPTHPRPLHGKC